MDHLAELGITKNGLKEIKSRMSQGISVQSSPKELLQQYSFMMDGLVRKAFQNAQSNAPSPSVCLLAVGGYGRGELAPHSDIDLLLLHSSSSQSNLSSLVQGILYPLWDLGLDVSCSSRSISECLKMAQFDLHVKTGLIDGRYLDGEYEFFRTLYDLFTKKVLHHKVHAFAEILMKDLHQRHQKYEDPAFILEPNIKEGEGGLRDFQVGRWMVRTKYKTDRYDSILFPDHLQTLDKSIQFLWAARNQLHLLSGRRQDELTFELQEKVAPILGFPSGVKGIEDLMRQYHLSTQRILYFALSVLERTLSKPSLFKKVFFSFKGGKIDNDFGIRNGEITLVDPITLKKDPSLLMTLFEHCQTNRIKMDFRTEEAVLETLPFIDYRFRQSEKVNRTFLSLLGKGTELKAILRKMHELGVLSRYIPEFSEIEGKVHYDLYHIHPVDIHSILAVEELEKLKKGDYQKEYPLLSSLIKEIENPDILFLTALLHDIGKRGEGDHSSVGAELARNIADRMGLSEEEKQLIHSLVHHHLFMLETAFRRDLNDEQAIMHFADQVKSMTQLKMLYLLTFADIKAVGPEAWTSWKNILLMELFLRTSHLLEKKEHMGTAFKRDEITERLRKCLPEGIVSEYVEPLPDRYLSSYSFEEMVHHIEMARHIEKEFLLVEWEIEKEIHAKVTLCTKDRYGLFSKIAGSMFINRLNILEAQIHTWGNGVALDIFFVEDLTRNIEQRLQQFKQDLGGILNGKASLKTLLSQRIDPNSINTKVIPKVSTQVKIDNQDSDFYTIVEITGEDRMGILYSMAQALTDHGCDIHFARISTLGNRFVDVFYVQDAWGEKLENKDSMERLRHALLSCLIST